jgi:DNA-binding Lrp family transcriptional regulator
VRTAFVLISAEPSRIADLATELAEVEGVAEVYSTAGDADIVAVVRVHSHEDLADVVTKQIVSHRGILSTRTLVAFQVFSQRDVAALWDFD